MIWAKNYDSVFLQKFKVYTFAQYIGAYYCQYLCTIEFLFQIQITGRNAYFLFLIYITTTALWPSLLPKSIQLLKYTLVSRAKN